jgi:exonuclease III
MKRVFLIASWLTDPICKAREKYWLGRALNKTQYFQVMLYAIIGVPLAFMGIIMRWVAKLFQSVPYLYTRGANREIVLEKELKLLSWNICSISAGYSITDGGVFPWEYRMRNIIQKIIEQNVDVVCLMEVVDIHAANYLVTHLKNKYAHIYYNVGPKAFGVSSGFLVACKAAINNIEFIRFPKEHLVGRTKNAAKGVFGFTISMNNKDISIFLTHLQHSEECEFPTKEEVFAREGQMKVILDQIRKYYHTDSIVLTGDLNMDEQELQKSSWFNQFDRGIFPKEKTWLGDEFCAKLVGKKASSARTYDYTMTRKDSNLCIVSSYVKTGYDSKEFKKEALSDHLGIRTVIKAI